MEFVALVNVITADPLIFHRLCVSRHLLLSRINIKSAIFAQSLVCNVQVVAILRYIPRVKPLPRIVLLIKHISQPRWGWSYHAHYVKFLVYCVLDTITHGHQCTKTILILTVLFLRNILNLVPVFVPCVTYLAYSVYEIIITTKSLFVKKVRLRYSSWCVSHIHSHICFYFLDHSSSMQAVVSLNTI
jgi:hypothetical protein